jgi:hypothetical protein
MSFSPIRTLLGAVTLIAASFSSQATLITNGDFEMNLVNPGKYATFSNTLDTGWQGSSIEIWNAFNGVVAVSGNNFIELNSSKIAKGQLHSIFQTFATEIGRQYELSFFYRGRTNNGEAFKVSFAGLEQVFNELTTRGWFEYRTTFAATETVSTLRFSSLKSGTVGNFLDNVQVSPSLPTAAVAVPEPTTLAAFGAGLLALFGLRRNKVKA